MNTSNEHRISIYWRGQLAAPVSGERAFSNMPEDVREDLIDLYCAADALLDTRDYKPGLQPVDVIARQANAADFKAEFPNDLIEFVQDHGHEVALIALGKNH